MNEPRVVPYTPMLSLYHEVKHTLHDEQLHERALEINAGDGAEVVSAFCQTIEILNERYLNEDTFHDTPRSPRPAARPFPTGGTDVAWFLKQQGRLEVKGEPDLAVEYVEYELSVLGTRGSAVFDKPFIHDPDKPNPSAGGPLKADLVLVNAKDRASVMGEVKVCGDSEPFSGLIQLLAYIAHAASRSQYARLCKHLAAAGYPEADPAHFDGYVLLHRYGQVWRGDEVGFVDVGNSWLDKLSDEAGKLRDFLLGAPAVAAQIRHLICLDLTFEDGRLVGHRRF